MKTRERRDAILQELTVNKRVYITDLSAKLNVSSMTIRRDLQRLAAMDIVTLVQGGAVYNEGGSAISNVAARAQRMQREKNILGTYCANLVGEGNAIYLDSGSTIINVANALSTRQNIAVLSNSLPVLNILSNAKDIQLIALPGVYRKDAKGFFGDMTRRMVESFRIDIAFLGVSAINTESGLTTPMTFDQALKRVLLETARKKILVTDHTKIGQEYFLKVCGLREVDQIITNSQAPTEFVDKVRRMGVDIVQV